MRGLPRMGLLLSINELTKVFAPGLRSDAAPLFQRVTLVRQWIQSLFLGGIRPLFVVAV